MNKFLLAAAAVSVVGMTITGCSKDEVLSDRKTSESNVIGFNLGGSNASLSRATPITDDNLTGNPFDVFAFTTDGGKLFMGTQNTLDYGNGNVYDWHDGVTIQWDANAGTAGEWVYKNPDDQAYWPSEALTFYAVYPAQENRDKFGWVVKSDKQQIGYHAWGDEFSATAHKNIDLMYAVAAGVTKESCNGTVKMTFKHTLSQVLFQARKELKSMDVNIKSIHIGNVRVGGTFTFPAAGVEPSAANWNTTGDMEDIDMQEYLTHPKKTDAVALTWDETNDKAVVAMISSATDVMMPVPQKLVKWSTVVGTPKTITEATVAGQSYLHIKCQIKKNGIYYVGSEGTADANYGDVYVPFEAQWEPGKRYIYTLVFGGGYKADGTPILDPIKIDAEQEDWKSPDVESDVTM